MRKKTMIAIFVNISPADREETAGDTPDKLPCGSEPAEYVRGLWRV